jgi:hypothetical protein
MVTTAAPRIVTPVTWLMAPELLTIDEALHLSGWSESLLRWDVYEGWVLANDGDDGEWLIDRDSLHDSME